MRYLIFTIIVLLVGCQEKASDILFNPAPGDVAGVWESASLYQYYPFSALKLSKDGSGKVVLVTKDKEAVEGLITEFQTKEKSFLVTLSGVEDPGDSELWEGSVIRGQLCFQPVDKKTEALKEILFPCFTRAEDLRGFREVAYKSLKVD